MSASADALGIHLPASPLHPAAPSDAAVIVDPGAEDDVHPGRPNDDGGGDDDGIVGLELLPPEPASLSGLICDAASMSLDEESFSQSALGSGLTAIIPGLLHIGAFRDVADPVACASYRIDAFLCVADGLARPLPPHASRPRWGSEGGVVAPPPPFLHLPLQDKPGQELDAHITAACAFIDEQAAAGRRVAVYCQAGRSRSASIAASYLMHVNPAWSAAEAVDALRAVYPRADPNMGFLDKITSPALLSTKARLD